MMNCLLSLLFPALLLLYMAWRTWVAVKHLDRMPWEFPVLVFLIMTPLAGTLVLYAAKGLSLDAGSRGANLAAVALTLGATTAIVYPLNRRYEAWCRKKQEERQEREEGPDGSL